MDGRNDLCTKQIHEVCAPYVKPQIDSKDLYHISYDMDGYTRWKSLLAKDQIVMGNTKDLPLGERRFLEVQDIKSILIIPIRVDQRWFGFIGFDYTVKEKEWSNWDINLLRTASSLFGIYLQNKHSKYLIQKQNEELRRMLDDKNSFIKILTHDLKNPFSTLLGFTNLLVERYDDYDSIEIKRFLRIVNQSAQNTYNLLDDMLLWIKSQSDKFPFQPQKIVFSDFCESIIENLSANALKKNVIVGYSDPEGLSFTDDINLLKIILRNLISNAIKFSNDNGLVNVTAKLVDTGVEICVADNGVGISKENQEFIWNISKPFTTRGTANEKGTGVGLMLCKQLVEKHGGTIWVES